MKFSACTYLVSLLLLLHCIGGTQLLSAFAKDKATFINMLSLTEEETKKEKDANSDDDTDPECKYRKHSCFHISNYGLSIIRLAILNSCEEHQVITELSTPPPDRQA